MNVQKIIEVKLKIEVCNKAYGVNDLKALINVFNEIHNGAMNIKIERIKEKNEKTNY